MGAEGGSLRLLWRRLRAPFSRPSRAFAPARSMERVIRLGQLAGGEDAAGHRRALLLESRRQAQDIRLQRGHSLLGAVQALALLKWTRGDRLGGSREGGEMRWVWDFVRAGTAAPACAFPASRVRPGAAPGVQVGAWPDLSDPVRCARP